MLLSFIWTHFLCRWQHEKRRLKENSRKFSVLESLGQKQLTETSFQFFECWSVCAFGINFSRGFRDFQFFGCWSLRDFAINFFPGFVNFLQHVLSVLIFWLPTVSLWKFLKSSLCPWGMLKVLAGRSQKNCLLSHWQEISVIIYLRGLFNAEQLCAVCSTRKKVTVSDSENCLKNTFDT